MLPDDLVGSVSLETLGAGVPGENATVGIQHENRIVSDALDEEPEALLALLQLFSPAERFAFHALRVACNGPAQPLSKHRFALACSRSRSLHVVTSAASAVIAEPEGISHLGFQVETDAELRGHAGAIAGRGCSDGRRK